MEIRDRLPEDTRRRRVLLLVLLLVLVLLGAGTGMFVPGSDDEGEVPTIETTPVSPTPTSPSPAGSTPGGDTVTATRTTAAGSGPTGTTPSSPTPTASTATPASPTATTPTRTTGSTPTATPQATGSLTTASAATAPPATPPGATAGGGDGDGGEAGGGGDPVHLEVAGTSLFLSFSDVTPGTATTAAVEVENTGSEPGELHVRNITVEESENGLTEPEASVDSTPNQGELADHVMVVLAVTYPDGRTETLYGTGNRARSLSALAAAESAGKTGVLDPGETATVRVDWYVPASTSNVIQSDAVTSAVTFRLVQQP